MGVVPMVELPNRPLLVEQPISDISGVIAMQDAINLLWSQLLVASDFASLQQRIVIGAEIPKIPILDASGQKVGEKPIELRKFALDRVLWLENPDAKIANWPSADLKAYTDIVEVAVGHIAAQTRTPQHYLVGKMANLSGDALIAAETGLVKKVQEKQLWFGQALREAFALMALARGETAKAAALSGGSVLWADTESRNIAQLTDSLLKLKQIGFPFEFLASRFGLNPTEVADLMRMREREAELDPVAAMMNAATLLGGLRRTARRRVHGQRLRHERHGRAGRTGSRGAPRRRPIRVRRHRLRWPIAGDTRSPAARPDVHRPVRWRVTDRGSCPRRGAASDAHRDRGG
jgi:hypothetical protein